MIKAVIYARYSSHSQREESIEGQVRECQAFAARNDMVIIGEYIDRALSGKTDNRADFQRMIRDSEKGHFQAVIMYTLDRFARNRYDSAMYKARLKRNGVRVYYAKQYIPDEPEGIILESVLEGYAEYYSENLSRNIKRGMMENALACKVTGGTIPLGYRIGADKTYEIDPAGAKIVREIYSMYADGHSAKEVIDYCNEQGYRTARKTQFNKNSLRTILTNPKYTGVYSYGEVTKEGGMPVIISKELFDRVQQRYKHNFTARAKGKARDDYLLTGKVFCGHCGSPLTGECGVGKNNVRYSYYKCADRKHNGTCHKKPEKKDWLEELVVRYTIQTVLTDESIEQISTRAMEIIEKEANDNSVLPQLRASLSDAQKRLKNLLELAERGIVTDSTKERLIELESQKKDLLARIAREENKKPRLTKERIQFWLESFRQGDIDDPDYRMRVIDTLVNSVFVWDDPNGKGRKIVFTFNVSGQNTATLKLSDIACFAPPNRANPKPFFYVKNCFGFVIETEG